MGITKVYFKRLQLLRKDTASLNLQSALHNLYSDPVYLGEADHSINYQLTDRKELRSRDGNMTKSVHFIGV